MSAKTTFWFAVMVLTVVASAVAGPLATVNTPESENEAAVVNTLAPSKTDTSADASVEPTDLLPPAKPVEQQQNQQTEGSSEVELVPTDPGKFDVMPNVSVQPDEPVASDPPSTAVSGIGSPSAAPAAGTDLPSAAGTGPAYGKKPRPPYYPTGVQTAVGFGPAHPSIPFFLEFFQPFQSLQPPFRHQQQPFGASVDPFYPFASAPAPAQPSPFHQLVEAYTNEFRNMLESLEKMPTMPQMTNVVNKQDGSGKPLTKTTSKTEIIDGHVVQVNETTYSDGDENHKTFYHFKEIQVLPDTVNKKIANEKLVTMTKDDSESQRVETNEIRQDPADATTSFPERGDEKLKEMRKAGPVPLDDHYQTAAASYYSPYAPAYYGPRPVMHPTGQLVYYGRPPVGYGHPMSGPYGHPIPGPYGGHPIPGPYGGHPVHYEQQQRPISLYGDTLVNDLLDASNQAAGVEVVLPPDVELIDVDRKPQRGNQQLYYKSDPRQQRPTPPSRSQQVFRAPSA
ncbi:uncharacterized protein LOC112690362 isoform X2 [Sipha flava]|uniref:Uncharacterized protein LOC112690362 isoform X2 n=1 Tax=Sipha flava TaxID=143950 RepID=A0A8B8GC11_9HEMI|nr:uncharacterized protein LOC112690362 isoform X2 [Sipha flava]